MKKNQRTISKPVEFEGVGLFGGQKGKLRISPAAPNSGITFVRTDLPEKPRIPVTPDTVNSKYRRSAVSGDNAEIETIEHLMSAIGGLEIDNLDIEINAAEIPNADGSSKPFVELLRGAGFADQAEARRVHVIREPIAVSDNEASIVAMPGENGLTVSYTLNYPNTPIGQQHLTVEMTDENYAKLISPARTFCLQSEAEAFIAQGLGKGASYQTTVVWGPNGPIENTLRFADEPVRHKILDLMGDLATLGAGLRAHIFALKSGHTTNMKLVKKIAASFGEGGQVQARPGGTLLDVREISKILPHRFPFLLIDKVVELDGYRRAVGIKNVSFNEPFFQGHFPGQPIMPGVLQIEAMAQLAGVLLMRKSDNQAKVAVLLSLDGVKLRKNVVPGDQLRIEVETLKVKARTGEVFARATVDGQLVAEANMKFMLMDGQP
jgi:UDP-3-O-[3-hydroxymyristoyl] N-acetylglucosamine deacetylase/3-hydroxyacyl-[acyl-carrier-protein] dehydratase